MNAKILTKSDKYFNYINYTFLTLFLLTVLYPLYFIVIASFSDPNTVYAGEVWILPKNITFEGYERIFEHTEIWRGYKNTIIYTTVGTTINVFLTITAAYSLSRKNLMGKNIIMLLITFTMFFQGGLIPTYLVVKKMGILNTMWALILPNAVWVYNLIITKTFFETSVPYELFEAANIDGCNHTIFFFKIMMPLSKAIIAVMILFYGVAHWNAFFEALIYLRDEKFYPLQIILRNILIENEAADTMVEDASTVALKQRISDLIKFGAIIIASLPVLMIYPFLQKYFVQGIMIGAIKG